MKRITWMTTLGCCAALLVTALVLTSHMLETINAEGSTLSSYAVYVGDDTCFTCHDDQPGGWVGKLQPRELGDEISNPHAVAVNLDAEVTVRPLELDITSTPYTNASFTNDGASRGKQYIVSTDAGSLLLPGHWKADNLQFFELNPNGELMTRCTDCHTGSFDASDDLADWLPESPDSLTPALTTGVDDGS